MVGFQIQERCAFIRLIRPDKRNALNAELVEGLQEAFEKAIESPQVKVIQLEGEGKVFCAGADLASIQAMRAFSDAENEADSRKLARLFLTIYHSPKPVIAVVRGAALAGGCGLATVCDIVIAEENTKFGYTETRLGFVPAIVSVFAVRKMSESHVRKMLLTAAIVPASEAASMGLITEAVAADQLDVRVAFWRTAFLNQVSGAAVETTKKLIEAAYTLSFESAIENAIRANVEARASEDCRNGIDRFLNGEEQRW